MPSTRPLSPEVPLLEREVELAALEAMLGAARDGDGRLVLVEGGAGIGKTRLLAAARQLAETAGMQILTARGGELEGDFAFGVVRQLFEAPLALAEPSLRDSLLAGAAGASAPLFASAPESASTDGGTTSFAMLHALYWLAANIAFARPALMLVDDIHWADEASLHWLTYLARRLDGLPLMLLAAGRPPSQATRPELAAELAGDPSATVIRPGALAAPAVARLTSDRLGQEPDAAFVAALHTASGGNPLYLAALLDTLVLADVPPTAESAPEVQQLGSGAVARSLATRVARLSVAAAQLLRAAAILGDDMPVVSVAAVAGLGARAALEAAGELVAADLLRREDPPEFTHPVVRSGVLESMSRAQRDHGHREAAATLLVAGAPAEQAAAHLLLTIPAGDPSAVATLRKAAARSSSRGAPQAAATLLGRALAEPPTAAERIEVLHELGVAELNVSAPNADEHLRQAMEASGGATGRLDIVLDYVRACTLIGGFEAGEAVLQAACDGLRLTDPAEFWRLEGRRLIWSQFAPDAYTLAVERSRSIDEEDLDGGAEAGLLLGAWAMVECRRGVSRTKTIDYAERALASGAFAAAAERLNIVNVVHAITVAGELADAGGHYDDAIAAAKRNGDLLSPSALQLFRGNVRALSGDLLGAEEDLRPLDRVPFFESPDFRAYHAGFLSEVLLERGDIQGAEALVARPTTANRGYQFYFLHGRGRVLLAAGRPDQALGVLREAGEIATATGVDNPAFLAWRSSAARALHRLERPAEAAELAHEELDLARRWGVSGAIGIALCALAAVGPPPDAGTLLEEAVELLSSSPARLAHAHALVDHGAWLRRTNRRSAARERLRVGVDIAHRCGAVPLAERANDELAATGAHRRTVLAVGVDALTASERRVAALAADDLSNKEIAQSLFVTVKTVEQHLGRVYRKLDIGSRRQLGEALALAEPRRAPS